MSKRELSPEEKVIQEGIIQQRLEIEDAIEDAQAALDAQRARLRALQAKCRHPRAYMTSMGRESTKYCPDCKWSR